MHWKKLKSKKVLKNDFLDITANDYIRPDGKLINGFYKIEKPDAAIIFATDEQNRLIMIRQYRHAVDSIKFELPAGYKEKSDKNMMQTAKRELLEETGYSAKKIIKLGEAYASAGILTNSIHFFLAKNCKKISEQNLDFSEDIEIHAIEIEKAEKLFKAGEIKDLGISMCFLLGINHLKNE